MRNKHQMFILSLFLLTGVFSGCEQEILDDNLGEQPAFEQEPNATEKTLPEEAW